jgi:hypothetical protein
VGLLGLPVCGAMFVLPRTALEIRQSFRMGSSTSICPTPAFQSNGAYNALFSVHLEFPSQNFVRLLRECG